MTLITPPKSVLRAKSFRARQKLAQEHILAEARRILGVLGADETMLSRHFVQELVGRMAASRYMTNREDALNALAVLQRQGEVEFSLKAPISVTAKLEAADETKLTPYHLNYMPTSLYKIRSYERTLENQQRALQTQHKIQKLLEEGATIMVKTADGELKEVKFTLDKPEKKNTGVGGKKG